MKVFFILFMVFSHSGSIEKFDTLEECEAARKAVTSIDWFSRPSLEGTICIRVEAKP